MKKRKIKKIIKILIILICTILILGLSIFAFLRNKKVNTDKSIVVPETPTEEIKEPTTFLNKVSNGEGFGVKDGWQELIVKYMDLYFKSMYELNTADFTTLFTDPNGNEAYLTQKATELLIKHHAMQVNDMSLTDAKYDIEYKNITINGNYVTIEFLETDYLKFKYLNGIESKAYDVDNTIVIKKTDDNYTIESIRVIQGYYIMFTNEIDTTSTNAKSNIDSLEAKYLDKSKVEVETNKELQKEATNTKYVASKKADHSYDRDKALSYANEYVTKRNSEFTAYDNSGGNCQNFVSQCVNAGGIPMDYKGAEQWKHYSSNLDNSNSQKGRTASWISTNAFYTYATNNTGFGLVSEVDLNLFYGEIGDVVHVGYNGYSHAVVVVNQVKNSSGEVVDLLINCNTVTLENYPLLGYVYPNKRLIKIIGYNN